MIHIALPWLACVASVHAMMPSCRFRHPQDCHGLRPSAKPGTSQWISCASRSRDMTGPLETTRLGRKVDPVCERRPAVQEGVPGLNGRRRGPGRHCRVFPGTVSDAWTRSGRARQACRHRFLSDGEVICGIRSSKNRPPVWPGDHHESLRTWDRCHSVLDVGQGRQTSTPCPPRRLWP